MRVSSCCGVSMRHHRSCGSTRQHGHMHACEGVPCLLRYRPVQGTAGGYAQTQAGKIYQYSTTWPCHQRIASADAASITCGGITARNERYRPNRTYVDMLPKQASKRAQPRRRAVPCCACLVGVGVGGLHVHAVLPPAQVPPVLAPVAVQANRRAADLVLVHLMLQRVQVAAGSEQRDRRTGGHARVCVCVTSTPASNTHAPTSPKRVC